MSEMKYIKKLFSKVYVKGLKQKHIDYLNTHALSKKELKHIKRQLKIFYIENKAGHNVLTLLIAIVVGSGSITLTLLNIFIDDTRSPILYIAAVAIAFVFLALLILLAYSSAKDMVRLSWTIWKTGKLTKKKYREMLTNLMIEYRR